MGNFKGANRKLIGRFLSTDQLLYLARMSKWDLKIVKMLIKSRVIPVKEEVLTAELYDNLVNKLGIAKIAVNPLRVRLEDEKAIKNYFEDTRFLPLLQNTSVLSNQTIQKLSDLLGIKEGETIPYIGTFFLQAHLKGKIRVKSVFKLYIGSESSYEDLQIEDCNQIEINLKEDNLSNWPVKNSLSVHKITRYEGVYPTAVMNECKKLKELFLNFDNDTGKPVYLPCLTKMSVQANSTSQRVILPTAPNLKILNLNWIKIDAKMYSYIRSLSRLTILNLRTVWLEVIEPHIDMFPRNLLSFSLREYDEMSKYPVTYYKPTDTLRERLLQELEKPNSIEYLSINKIGETERFMEVVAKSKIKKLEIDPCFEGKPKKYKGSPLANLKHVHAHGDKARAFYFSLFQYFTNVTRFDFMETKQLSKIEHKMPNLKVLKLKNTKSLESTKPPILEVMFNNLTSLYLRKLEQKDFKFIKNFVSLEELEIEGESSFDDEYLWSIFDMIPSLLRLTFTGKSKNYKQRFYRRNKDKAISITAPIRKLDDFF